MDGEVGSRINHEFYRGLAKLPCLTTRERGRRSKFPKIWPRGIWMTPFRTLTYKQKAFPFCHCSTRWFDNRVIPFLWSRFLGWHSWPGKSFCQGEKPRWDNEFSGYILNDQIMTEFPGGTHFTIRLHWNLSVDLIPNFLANPYAYVGWLL